MCSSTSSKHFEHRVTGIRGVGSSRKKSCAVRRSTLVMSVPVRCRCGNEMLDQFNNIGFWAWASAPTRANSSSPPPSLPRRVMSTQVQASRMGSTRAHALWFSNSTFALGHSATRATTHRRLRVLRSHMPLIIAGKPTTSATALSGPATKSRQWRVVPLSAGGFAGPPPL